MPQGMGILPGRFWNLDSVGEDVSSVCLSVPGQGFWAKFVNKPFWFIFFPKNNLCGGTVVAHGGGKKPE